MIRHRFYILVFFICAAAAAIAQNAPPAGVPKSAPPPLSTVTPPPPVKMGLWESKTTTQMSGFTLPPDVVAKLQAMGKPVPGGPHTYVTHSCLTADQWQKEMEHINDPKNNCQVSNRTMSGDKWSFDMTCGTERGMTMTGHFEALITDDDHAHGSAHMKADNMGPNGQTITSEMTFDSHRLGADCADVKPGSPQEISDQ